jgi:hypothetical protein
MCFVSEVTIGPAGAMDVVRMAEIIHGEPSPETVGLVGDRRLASAFGEGLVELDHIPNSAKPTVVAEVDGRVVGVLQYTIGEGMNVTLATCAWRCVWPGSRGSFGHCRASSPADGWTCLRRAAPST